MTYHSKAFTLIELLVVVSIISMLSSVVLAALSGARDKGRVGAGMTFASTAYHLFAATEFGWYDFNSGSGNALDASQYKRDGVLTFMNSPYGYVNTTPGGSGYALSFDGSTSFVDINTSLVPTYQLPSSFTNMAWIYPTALPSSPNVKGFMGSGGGSTGFGVNSSGGVQYNCNGVTYSSTSGVISTNKWNHVAIIAEGAKATFYVNGRDVTSTSNAAYSCPPQPLFSRIGYAYNGMQFFQGMIDDVGIFQTPMTLSEIRNVYFAGIAEHSDGTVFVKQ